MHRKGNSPKKDTSRIFAEIGRDLASITDAKEAARTILNAADQLIGWDASYLILYDPEIGGVPRPLLLIDTIEGVHVEQFGANPSEPSENMLKAIRDGEFMSVYEKYFEVDTQYSFGDRSKRTLSQMFVPVRTVARVIGVMSIQSYDFEAYTGEQLGSLKNLASHCAGALERIWAQEALGDFVERLKVLHDAVNAINTHHEVEKVCRVVYETVASVMSCNDFVIDGYSKNMNLIEPLFAIEHPGIRVFTNGYVADHGLAGEVVRTRKTLLFNSKQELMESGITFEPYGSVVEEDPTQSCLAVPMLLHDDIYGMVSAQSYKKNAYNRDDLYLLEVLASHAAIAIENARLFDSIQTLANTDSLTGILNRRRFFELAEVEYEKAGLNSMPLSVILLDVDDFKLFNDKHGHSVGDAVLNTVAEICSAHLRSNDIFGRMGGEEFAVVLPDAILSNALEVAERLRYAIENLEFTHDSNLHTRDERHLITVSVGVAEYSSDCTSLDELLDRADKAMYQSKSLGRNRVHVWHVEK
ncbi:MAG: diguanylate cyclase [Anaerolineales bacterium]|nr:diguanylate cyclase [Anaerolineales bacterium]MCB9145919.1 diguanylate cyclase [Anaerolineales bacterium]